MGPEAAEEFADQVEWNATYAVAGGIAVSLSVVLVMLADDAGPHPYFETFAAGLADTGGILEGTHTPLQGWRDGAAVASLKLCDVRRAVSDAARGEDPSDLLPPMPVDKDDPLAAIFVVRTEISKDEDDEAAGEAADAEDEQNYQSACDACAVWITDLIDGKLAIVSVSFPVGLLDVEEELVQTIEFIDKLFEDKDLRLELAAQAREDAERFLLTARDEAGNEQITCRVGTRDGAVYLQALAVSGKCLDEMGFPGLKENAALELLEGLGISAVLEIEEPG
jgi:hypothetical protein